MDEDDRMPATWVCQSESESHSEHQAALDATLFHPIGEFQELVFELDAGELRIRKPRRA
jgi:hypothetical protein